MYSNRLKSHGRSLMNFRNIEKMFYAAIVPVSFGYYAYKLYKQNVIEADQRASELKELEDLYIKEARDNIQTIAQLIKE